MSGRSWLALALAVPLLLAPLAPVPATRAVAWALAPWAALASLAVAVFAGEAALSLPALLTGATLGLDAIGRVFLGSAALVGLLAGFSLRAGHADDPHRFRLATFYLAGLGGALGVAAAQDIVTFYTCFALMAFAAYGFVIHAQTPFARRAGAIYIVLVVLGEGMLLSAFMLIAAQGGVALDDAPRAVAESPQRDWIVALLLGGFGVKAGLVPLHVSLPPAYAAAPAPGAVLLAGAMLGAGLLGWMRFLPLGAAALPEWGAVVAAAGALGMFYGAIAGLAQSEPKALLAYSSVSQMGFMIVALGLALHTPALAILAAAALPVYAAHHALVKSALFVGVAAAEGGLARRYVVAGAAVLALMLAGAPLTSGAIAKFYLKGVAQAAPASWSAVEPLYEAGAVATALMMIRFLRLLWLQSRAASGGRSGFAGLWVAALVLCAAAIWFVRGVDVEVLAHHWREPAAWWDESWPVLAAAVAAAVWLARGGRVRARPWIPPGDVVVPLQRALRAVRLRDVRFAFARRQRVRLDAAVARRAPAGAVAPVSPAWLQRWSVAGTLFVLLALAVLLLLAR